MICPRTHNKVTTGPGLEFMPRYPERSRDGNKYHYEVWPLFADVRQSRQFCEAASFIPLSGPQQSTHCYSHFTDEQTEAHWGQFSYPESHKPCWVGCQFNSRYSRGRDQKDGNLKPAWANSSQDPLSKISNTAGCQWLTPVILATKETEFRRILVQSQSWRPNLEKPSHTHTHTHTHTKRVARVA
jgi:hypothetical protein